MLCMRGHSALKHEVICQRSAKVRKILCFFPHHLLFSPHRHLYGTLVFMGAVNLWLQCAARGEKLKSTDRKKSFRLSWSMNSVGWGGQKNKKKHARDLSEWLKLSSSDELGRKYAMPHGYGCTCVRYNRLLAQCLTALQQTEWYRSYMTKEREEKKPLNNSAVISCTNRVNWEWFLGVNMFRT